MHSNDLPELINSKQSMFDIFWEKFIVPTIFNVLADVDPDFKAACDFKIAYDDIAEYREALRKTYREKREWLKEIYMPHAAKPILDIHKLGAVICRSLIGNKPYSFNIADAEAFVIKKFGNTKSEQNTDWFFSNIYANYKVAFYASIGAAYLNILYRSQKANDSDSLDYFANNSCLNFYKQNKSHECFENSCMISLQKNDLLGRSFDYLGYSILIYQLEQYNYPTLDTE